ncbi:MAG TPA: hypothetical protein ENJ20_01575 [Bacteroidetes bacterium]|nr:hypothetical protein [Bacteroidota bacterium]
MKNYILLLMIFLPAYFTAQNPHGAEIKTDCAACHSPESWDIPAARWNAGELVVPEGAEQRTFFSHTKTGFPLTGQHAVIDCRDCHRSLVFSEARSECISCHTDLHQMTVGDDCTRCHSTENWLVDNITQLHQDNGFPLFGNHITAACNQCHTSETELRFDRIGNDCINCHLEDFTATTSPDHEAAGYSKDCMICHDVTSPSWEWIAGYANHSFFPLTDGHDIADCNACHTNGDFTNTPTDCFACHEDDFRSTTSPDHEAGGFPMDCSLCHNTQPGWPATDFSQHDQIYFPIFSGKHKGEWNDCTECHTTPGDFKSFSCIDCHEHNNPAKLAREHDDVSGYSFSSPACYSCHPDGDE